MEPTGLKDSTGVVEDPEEKRLKVTYWVSDQDAYLPDIFTAFLDALATVTASDSKGAGAVVNVVSFSGDLTVNVHGRTTTSLHWVIVSIALKLVWEKVIMGGNLKEIEFEI